MLPNTANLPFLTEKKSTVQRQQKYQQEAAVKMTSNILIGID